MPGSGYAGFRHACGLSGRWEVFGSGDSEASPAPRVHAGAGYGGSLDVFNGTSSNGPVVGGGITLGASAGASASLTNTTTLVCGLAGCEGSLAQQLLPSQTGINLGQQTVPSSQANLTNNISNIGISSPRQSSGLSSSSIARNKSFK